MGNSTDATTSTADGELDMGLMDHIAELEHRGRYRFDARFVTEAGELRMDEPAPLGPGTGPEGVTLLATAAGYCMSASLVFSLRKMRVDPERLHTTATAHLKRTPERYRRVSALDIHIDVEVKEEYRAKLERALAYFHELCIVTESIRGTFPITIRVHHPWGVYIKELPTRV